MMSNCMFVTCLDINKIRSNQYVHFQLCLVTAAPVKMEELVSIPQPIMPSHASAGMDLRELSAKMKVH